MVYLVRDLQLFNKLKHFLEMSPAFVAEEPDGFRRLLGERAAFLVGTLKQVQWVLPHERPTALRESRQMFAIIISEFASETAKRFAVADAVERQR